MVDVRSFKVREDKDFQKTKIKNRKMPQGHFGIAGAT
jgi:hypothetical protein